MLYCEHCKRPGPDAEFTIYPFHYGRKVGDKKLTSQTRTGNQIRSTWRQEYEVCGQKSVALHAHCVNRRSWIWRATGLVLALGSFVFMGNVNSASLGEWGVPFMIAGLIAVMVAGFGGFGQRWARRLGSADLKKQFGYDMIWNDKEYADLRRQNQPQQPTRLSR